MQTPPYRMADENLMASMKASEIDRASRATEDGDALHEESASTRHRGWFLGFLVILGIAAIFIFLYLLRFL